MFKNYFVTAIRNITREKVFALMNIAGLALGIGCALVIYKVITYELSYDTHHSNYEQTYRLVREVTRATDIDYTASVPHPLGPTLKSEFPDLKVVMTHYNASGQITLIDENDQKSKFQEENGVAFVQPNVFEVFDFQFIEGNPATCLENRGSVVLTTSLAQKYFKLKSDEVHKAIGKTLTIDNSVTSMVTGVIADTPKNTDIPFTMFFSYQDLEKINPYYDDGKNWRSNSSSTNCYLVVPKNMSVSHLKSQFPQFIDKHFEENGSEKLKYDLQPLSDLHSSDRYNNYNEHQVTEGMLYALGIIGLFLIITASINFINLTTAQAVKRSKEVGIRKTLGSNKGQLVLQFLGETILISFLAAFIGLIISELLLVYLEEIIGYRLSLDLLANPSSLMFLVGLATAVGLLSGFYPAIVMSRMNPVVAMKNSLNLKSKSGLMSLRRVLVIIQFSISQILIIGTIVVGMQIDYFLAKDLGFSKESILLSYLPENDKDKLRVFKTNLLEHPSINKVSFSLSSPLGTSTSSTNFHHKSLNEEDEYNVNMKIVDEDYIDLYEIELLAGRNYNSTDSMKNVLINRKMATLIGFDNPAEAIGEKIRSWGNFNVIGVVEDFHTSSLEEEMDYIMLLQRTSMFYEVGIKFNTTDAGISDIQNVIKHTESSFNTSFSEYIFDYEFYDKQIAENYEGEQQTAKLFQLFAIIAIFIGCLGLYGLIAYMSNQKTKEIGIRKVLGASVFNILRIFSVEIVALILFSFAIAGPVGFLAMSSWLDNYAYCIDLTPLVFIVSLLVSLFIAISTIAYKSISASLANPVLSLKDE